MAVAVPNKSSGGGLAPGQWQVFGWLGLGLIYVSILLPTIVADHITGRDDGCEGVPWSGMLCLLTI